MSAKRFRNFRSARQFARGLGLRTLAEWRDYSKNGYLPKDIPSGPERVYKDKGWSGYGDWLATGNVQNGRRRYRAFRVARKFAQGLGLKSQAEWRSFVRGKTRPDDIPSRPDHVYRESGWIGYRDWLGYEMLMNSRSKSQDCWSITRD